MCKNRLRWLAVWLLGCAASVLLATSIQPEYTADLWTLAADRSAARVGEQMEAPMPDGNVSVNTADRDELCRLKGVGPALAERIIIEREQNGRFFFPEDLISVKGIGSKTLKKLYGQLSLD